MSSREKQLKKSGLIQTFPKALFVVALMAILTIPVMGYEWSHPGLGAIIICLSTLVIIWRNSTIANESRLVKPLVNLGDISYSLYLVHWPIIVFAHTVFPSKFTLTTQLILLIASITAAIVLYRFIEQPSRQVQISRPKLAGFVIIGAAILVSTQYIAANTHNTAIDFAHIRRPNYGLDQSCDYYQFQENEKCQTSRSASSIVWGDSYAMHTIEGIKNHRKDGIIQATYSACPPFLNTAPYNPARIDAEKVSNYCIDFNNSVISAIKTDKNIKTVILAASFWQYTVPGNKMQIRDPEANNLTRIIPTNLDLAEADLGNTIETLKRLGKEIIVIGPPPSVGNENITCMEQLLSTGTAPTDCSIPLGAYKQYNAGLITLLNTIETKHKVKVVRLSDALCDEKACRTILDGVPMYRDSGHLSYVGSAKAFDVLANTKSLW